MEKIRGRKLKKKKKKMFYKKLIMRMGIVILLVIIAVLLIRHFHKSKEKENESEIVAAEETEETSEENDFSVEDYPEELLELMEKNPETKEFVLNYPIKKSTYSNKDLVELEEIQGIPLLIQWDDRWGYYEYAGNIMGLTGCGPTSLSMVASYLLNDPKLTPIYIADYSTRNGHSIEGGGTAWSLMSQGAKELGLNPKEVPLDENVVKKHLENGRPIICNVGEGIFTDNGHYMVFVGWEDGKIKIHDPNRREYSERLWSFEEIQDQIKNMWVY